LVWLDFCDEHRNEGIKQAAAAGPNLNRPQEVSEDWNLSSVLILCSSQGSSSAASAARKEFFQPKDLVWLDSCDKHRNEGIKQAAAGGPNFNRPQEGIGGLQSLLPSSLCSCTGIQQRRVCGAGRALSAQGLGLAGFL
jgi:hypothetical protein